MNFLAHIYLSGNDPQLAIGNFIGDFVKAGSLVGRYEPQVIKGVALHRAIDEYTDSHEVVQKSKNRLRPKYRHYSGVIIDMFYDYYLAKNWDTFHKTSLPKFAEQFYLLLEENKEMLPEKALYMMPYMIQNNWLLNYRKKEGIHRALSGMSRRTSFDSKMDESIVELSKYDVQFENEFMEFFPQLKAFSDTWIESHQN
ncbi:MAG: acyl carrier protein phosphodiesterase [Cyclobacteriaceae bacterium]|nr:acyl carrier protein phosphodiesterase [Cyclobacteriaceae bacterium]